MEKIKAAVIGYGNIGRYVIEALQVAPDFEIVGVVRRNAADVPAELDKYKVVSHLQDLEGVQVAILCNPTRSVEHYATEALRLGINTVDSFDIHTQTVDLHRTLGEVARKHQAVSIMGPGNRFCNTCTIGSLCSERFDLYKLRPRHEYGPYGSRQSDRGSKGRPVYDYPHGNRDSPQNGIYRTSGRISLR